MPEIEHQRLWDCNRNQSANSGTKHNNGIDTNHSVQKHHQQHATQWERQSEWLNRTRDYQKKLVAQGVQGFDLMEAMTTLNLEHKIEASNHKCIGCWHDLTQHCICSRLLPLDLSLETMMMIHSHPSSSDNGGLDHPFMRIPIRIKIIVLMHSKEYMSAGNSAKLLIQLLPKQTELFLFGKKGEIDRLFEEIKVNKHNTMILWPGKNALSVADFLAASSVVASHKTRFGTHRAAEQPRLPPPPPVLVRAIVLDGTYTQARNMLASLRKRFGVNNLPVTVQLRPTTVSVFHRAQKNYGKAHQQQQPSSNESRQKSQTQPKISHCESLVPEIKETVSNQDVTQRICTAEACGLLLMELGATANIQEQIIEAIRINNEALGYGTRGTREFHKPSSS